MNTERKVAQALLKIGAVKSVIDNPITFKSGIISPIYVDNREFPYYPEQWKIVIEGFKSVIEEKNISYDIIAGVAIAGIPHSAALGFAVGKPSVFIRKEVKDHGSQKRVDGGEVRGKKVLLIEDLVSLGGSSLSAAQALRDEGAIVNDCLVIVSYDFAVAGEAFKKANVNLHTLTSFPIILEEAVNLKIFREEEIAKFKEWFASPYNWGK